MVWRMIAFLMVESGWFIRIGGVTPREIVSFVAWSQVIGESDKVVDVFEVEMVRKIAY